ncbi:hypothetical protein BJX62DRAFT_117575 [Aspergillus germanicus]
MAKGFEKISACSVGNFEENTTRIPKWIVNNGGQYSKQVTEETTHLIVTEEAFAKNVTAVSKAKELGTVWIVSYDWLSDSLLMNNRRPLPAKNYLLLEGSPVEETKVQKKVRQTKAQENKVTKNRVVKRKAAETKAAKGKPKPSKALEEEALRAQFEKEKADKEKAEKEKAEQEKAEQERAQRGQEVAHQPVEDHSTRNALQTTTAAEEKPKPIKKKRKRGPKKSGDPFDTKCRTPKAQSVGENYEIFEKEDITYDVKLVRPSKSKRGTREILRLKIYKSNEAPTTYATHISLSCLGPSKTDFLAPLGSSLETAMAAFKGFFKEQTGTEWEDRKKGISPPPEEG